MNFFKYKYQILSIFLAGVILYMYASQHDHGHDHGHSADELVVEESESNHAHEKMVALNSSQYKNAEIDTGWFVKKNISDVIHASGHTKLDPQNQASVGARVNGTIKSIRVIEGDYVKKGQLLAQLSSVDYNNLLMEEVKLRERMKSHEAQMDYLNSEYSRQKMLADKNINAKKTLEKVTTDLSIEKQKLEAVNRQLEIIKENISTVGNGGTNGVLVKTPISGYITDIDVIIGSQVLTGDPMFSIVDNSKMHVDLLVYEKDLGKVSIGQGVRFILTNQSNKEISGKIYNIGKSFANDSKSVEVHADIEDNESDLIPGMYVNALIDVGSNTVNSLPEEAIVFAEGRNFIFLWEKENLSSTAPEETTFTRLEIKAGVSQLGFTEVTPLGEIHEGDRIVTDGAYYLQSHLQKAEGGGGHHH